MRRPTPHLLVAVAILGAFASAGLAPSGTLAGRVVGVSDGDTLTLLTPARIEVKVRLEGVDAPEKAQPWGAHSKQALSRLTFNRTVAVRSTGRDRYGRTLGVVSAGRTDVNTVMVRDGAAWAYRQYLTDDRLIRLEGEARAARRGLWALPLAERTAPWTWRAAQRTPINPTVAQSSAGEFRCGTKRYCTEMRSCAEARFHLVQCGLKRLDADNDGVPCEAICGQSGGVTA